MRFRLEQAPRGTWRVMLEGAEAPVSEHDTEEEAIGALDPVAGEGIGIARFVREQPGGPVAEAAVAVADEWQGRGVGGVLLERLAERAREVGVAEFTASLLTSNRAMLALFARLG